MYTSTSLVLVFQSATFRPPSSSLQLYNPYRFLGHFLVTRHGWALTGSQYSGGPSSGCYSHYFGGQQTNPLPVHPIWVAVHLLDRHLVRLNQFFGWHRPARKSTSVPPNDFLCVRLQHRADWKLVQSVIDPTEDDWGSPQASAEQPSDESKTKGS